MEPTEPTAKKARLEALDVLRGLAIFGILVVNVLQMFIPMDLADSPLEMVPGEWGMMAAWTITDALFDTKFLTIFSLLFGIGFCLQWTRTHESPQRFRRLYLRRIVTLILFGLVHATFFYMADVLVIYALTALLLLPLRRWPTRRLAWVGGVLLTLILVWHGVISGPDEPERAAEQRAVVEEIDGIRRTGSITLVNNDFPLPRTLDLDDAFLVPSETEGRATLTQTEFDLPMPAPVAILVLDGNNSAEQSKVQYAVFSEGPIAAATFGRVSHFAALILLYTPFYLMWRTLALFLIGAALVKWGLFDGSRKTTWRRAALIGWGVGLPMSIVSTAIRAAAYETQNSTVYVGNGLHDVSALLLAMAITTTVLLWCASGEPGRVRRGLSTVGRTALTNYIGQSVVMSLLATSYGLGLYGDLSRMQLLGLACICFALQMVASSLWLRTFRMGPLEWVWRCLTYWRLLPLSIDPV